MALKDLLREQLNNPSNFRGSMHKLIRAEVEKFKSEIMQELQKVMAETIGQEGINKIKGDRGYTPKRGVDYLTSQELDEIRNELRPLKGRDYFDGLPGNRGQDGKSPSMRELQRMIDKIVSKIKLPDVDTKAIEERLTRLENIPKLPQSKKKFGGGGGMSDPIHTTFSGDGSTTTFTLSRAVAAGGNAIILRYNGQTLDLGSSSHYTVSNSTGVGVITTTFTPANGTTISVTYWGG